MPFLLDTCAISELVAKFSSPDVVDAIINMPRDEIFLSVITVGEIHSGIEDLPTSARKKVLRSWFDEHILGLYGPRTLLMDVLIAMRWGELRKDLRRRGLTMQVADSVLAATALTHDLVVVTRNEKDFAHAGVQILNPWH